MATLLLLLLLACCCMRHLGICCNFPSTLHMEAKDPPWYSHVKADGSRDMEYYIRHTVMEIHYPRSTQPHVRWKCSTHYQGKIMLKRQDQLVNNYYRCVKFVFRSRSVVQIMWSHEIKAFDLSLCDDSNLQADPWPLIWYGSLREDYTPCPFRGGFDMKIFDSLLGENGCNLMLKPMRLEAECVGGEGVSFNFVSSNCLPDIKMYVNQKTICVTDWQDSRNHYVILRRNEAVDLWCLVMPIDRGSNVTAYLFSDLACRSDTDRLRFVTDIKFFTLHLHTRVFSVLCEDEYDQCNKVACNAYVKQECQKSCNMCNASTHPRTCEYPQRFQGGWFLKDVFGYRSIDIRSSNFSIDGVGSFQCVSYSNSSTSKDTMYTTVSLYQNGCRPRYTCVKFNQLAPSVLRFSLSQSYVWPLFDNDPGKFICGEDRFHADASPIDDRYRPHEGTGKPIISRISRLETVHCNLSYVHTINATLPEGYVCPGSLYQHCEDPGVLRLEFDTCGSLIPAFRDYRCLANFEGHYWERILLLQNVRDEMDAICFVFSQFYPIEAYVLVASQCDQKSFNFARTGLRQPNLKFMFRTEQDTCKYVSVNPKLTNSYFDSTISDGSISQERLKSDSQSNMTNYDTNPHYPATIDSDSHPNQIGNSPKEDLHNDTPERLEPPSAKSTSFDRANLLQSSYSSDQSTLVTYSAGFTLILMTASVLCS